MKHLIRTLCFAMIVALFLGAALVSHGAEVTQTTLSNACAALELYIYPSVYQESEGYAAFQTAMTQAKTVASNQGSPNQRILSAYNDLRDAFVQLMKSTYDYSGMMTMAAADTWLDQTLYEPASMKAFISEAGICKNELSSPHLYPLEDRNKEEYIDFMQSKIDEITDSAVEKYNQLQLKKLPDTFTSRSLLSLSESMYITLRPELLKAAEGKEEYQESLDAARELLGKGTATEEEVSKCALSLIRNYNTYMRNRFDFSQVDQTLAEAKLILSDQYTESSYSAFSEAVDRLSFTLDQPVFFFLSSFQSTEIDEQNAQNRIDSLDDEVIKQKESLIKISDIELLNDLCGKYENITVDGSLSPYQSALLMAVNSGKELLQKDDYTAEEIAQAISLIDMTADNLKTAAEEYNQIQDGQIHDRKTKTQLIITFTLITLALSIGSAVFLSIQKNGKADFTK